MRMIERFRAHAGVLAGAMALAAILAVSHSAAVGGTIYNITAAGSNDFVPFENDGTPNRPLGSRMGNQITFAGTARYLDHVQVVFASIGPKEVDTYTLDLYKNDGSIDPTSGLARPGTLIAEFTTQASNIPLPGNGAYGVDWNFSPTLVPDSLTAIVSSSYSTTTPGQLMGPFVAVTQPLTGSARSTRCGMGTVRPATGRPTARGRSTTAALPTSSTCGSMRCNRSPSRDHWLSCRSACWAGRSSFWLAGKRSGAQQA